MKPTVGPVLWYQCEGAEPMAAIITRVLKGGEAEKLASVSLMIFHPDYERPLRVEACPRRDIASQRYGGWDWPEIER